MKKYVYFICVVMQGPNTLPDFQTLEFKRDSKIIGLKDIKSYEEHITSVHQARTGLKNVTAKIINYKLLREEEH